jgi:predicted phosphoribosyltransferase
MQPELAMGAIVDGSTPVVVRNERVIQLAGVSKSGFEAILRREAEEIERRRRRYLANSSPLEMEGRTAIIVDDGIATGATMMAAILGLRQRGPAAIVVAVPVAPFDEVKRLEQQADEVRCLLIPELFEAVGNYYEDFRQLTDDDVIALMEPFCPQISDS